MKTLLICPAKRPTVRLLSNDVPLALTPALGQSVVEYWLSHLASSGIKEVDLLVNDRPECVHAVVGDGTRWGLNIKVLEESRELSAAEALVKYDQSPGPGMQNGITVLDHFPGLPQFPLFKSYADWVAGVRAWMPHARMPDRVGVRNLRPDVWAGLNTRISPKAKVTGPCWLGKNVFVGPRAVLGPGAIVEDGSLIESNAEVMDSYIGPNTLVGKCVELRESLAWGSTLINWKTGSATEISDAFILCALRRPQAAPSGWLERMSEACSENKEEDHMFWKDFLIKREGGT